MTERCMFRSMVSIIIAAMMLLSCTVSAVPVHAGSVINKESIVSGVRNPENGIIKYKVRVPAGEKIDYSVELVPGKRSNAKDKISGSWINRSRKTVTKTITVRVKYLSNKYTIKASYTSDRIGHKIVYKDVDKAVSALKTTVVTAKLNWDFSLLGKGDKNWKYRYKYVPSKNGYKKYLQVFNENGKQIKNYLKTIVPITKITKLIREMRTR